MLLQQAIPKFWVFRIYPNPQYSHRRVFFEILSNLSEKADHELSVVSGDPPTVCRHIFRRFKVQASIRRVCCRSELCVCRLLYTLVRILPHWCMYDSGSRPDYGTQYFLSYTCWAEELDLKRRHIVLLRNKLFVCTWPWNNKRVSLISCTSKAPPF